MHVETPPPSNMMDDKTPLISADQKLPEITPKAVILAIILTTVLAAANAYLGLKVGTTVAASIPAAVISMGVLRFFRNSNVLENNIVQTAASAGEGLIAGIAYILPALLILHYWTKFNYLQTFMITLTGGLLGVMFSIPLRRVLLAHKGLRFPEGTAIGHVLKASVEGKSSLKQLVRGGLFGGLVSFAQTGLQVIADSMQFWYKSGTQFIYGFGAGFEPALIAAGYIVGVNVALSSLLGVIIGWVISIPVLSHSLGITAAATDPSATAMDIWHSHVRYIGVGTMLVGGIWTLFTLAKPIIEGLRSSFTSIKGINTNNDKIVVPRTERDIPIQIMLLSTLVLMIPVGGLVYYFVNHSALHIGSGLEVTLLIVGFLYVIFAGFTFSALNGYFVGLVGSTNSPGSALTLSALLIVSLLILALFSPAISFVSDPEQTMAAAALAIILTSIVSCGAVITNETIQDLKAGQMVGATPWKQQVMLLVGVFVACLVIPPILQLLFDAYGIGGVFPHPGMDPKQMLAAPQAGMMAAVARGVFAHNLPWPMINTGGVIAIICIMINQYLQRLNTNLPVLAVGLGIYLPLEASIPMIIGGIASYFIDRAARNRYRENTTVNHKQIFKGKQLGLILACGVVAGSSLMGVILAIPFAIAQSTDVLKIVSDSFTPIANILALLMTGGLVYWLYKVVIKKDPSIQ